MAETMIPRTIRMLPALSLTLAMFVFSGHLLLGNHDRTATESERQTAIGGRQKDEGKLAANNGPPRPDRRLTKEPVYRTYYLLAFGPEAKTSVWLSVFDGTTLYVDRNADGDLTQPGERFAPRESKIYTEGGDGKRIPDLEYDIPDVTERDGKAKHGIYVQLSRATDKEGGEYADVYVRVRTAAGYSQYSFFAHNLEKNRIGKSATAPFRHFGGPLHLKMMEPAPGFVPGERMELYAQIETPTDGFQKVCGGSRLWEGSRSAGGRQPNRDDRSAAGRRECEASHLHRAVGTAPLLRKHLPWPRDDPGGSHAGQREGHAVFPGMDEFAASACGDPGARRRQGPGEAGRMMPPTHPLQAADKNDLPKRP